jgi:hypothetical protein
MSRRVFILFLLAGMTGATYATDEGKQSQGIAGQDAGSK